LLNERPQTLSEIAHGWPTYRPRDTHQSPRWD
jgi:hypothetical protein